MRKIYYLSTCNTCKRIIKDLELKKKGFQFQDIKTDPITEEELDKIYQQTNSFEWIFNKRARKYRTLNLKDRVLSDHDYKELILKEYTFLKRPVIQVDNRYFIGNSKKTIKSVKERLDEAD